MHKLRQVKSSLIERVNFFSSLNDTITELHRW